MKYSEMKYERPDLAYIKKIFTEETDKIKEAVTFDNFEKSFDVIISIRKIFYSMQTITYLNFSKDMTDVYWSKEQDFLMTIVLYLII